MANDDDADVCPLPETLPGLQQGHPDTPGVTATDHSTWPGAIFTPYGGRVKVTFERGL